MGFEAVHVGIDVGKMTDPTALVAVQVMTDATLPTRYITQHLERVPLGMSYPDIAAHCVTVLSAIQALLTNQRAAQLTALAEQVKATGQQVSVGRTGIPQTEIRVFVDVTGVGRPVYDIVERAVRSDARIASIDLLPITFAHGETYNRKTGRMGKAYLVSRLQALLQERRLSLPPRHPEAQAMARELKDYEIHVSEDAKDTYGAFKVGAHDDLVTALGLAVLEDPGVTGARMRFFE
jgi:hypothetical protein